MSLDRCLRCRWQRQARVDSDEGKERVERGREREGVKECWGRARSAAMPGAAWNAAGATHAPRIPVKHTHSASPSCTARDGFQFPTQTRDARETGLQIKHPHRRLPNNAPATKMPLAQLVATGVQQGRNACCSRGSVHTAMIPH